MTTTATAAMTESRRPADHAARRRALDPAGSFIVQAPAGSGKTELLIQRLLVLLAQVDAPEEIVALTFTRKAAGEMRSRVVRALQQAAVERPPEQPHERATWELARAALARDAARGWSLLTQPGRLCILTIDGLCALLARRLPLLSRLGALPAIEEDAAALYREAAQATLALLEDGDEAQSQAVAAVLLHLDNRGSSAEDLLVAMLRRRDQWMRHVIGHDREQARPRLEAALAGVRSDAADAVRSLLAPLRPALLALVSEACGRIEEGSASAILAWQPLGGRWPEAREVACWVALADLLLTKDHDWRRNAPAEHGFPPQSAAANAALKLAYRQAQRRFVAVVEQCAAIDGLEEALRALRRLPPGEFTGPQWDVLAAVVDVLRLAAAQLELVFAQRGRCDFVAVAAAAWQALGTPAAPTDLLMALDARIRHLLVDEFQDTSVSQWDLLERLTGGWSAGDGRTLFIVGDPMQSIYRFREAEVGLFLRARHGGIGGLSLEPLQLSTNFRSQQGIVDWVNGAFARVLPAREDAQSGAVPYEPATPWAPPLAGAAVCVHSFVDAGAAAEAGAVQAVIAAALADPAVETLAVLVRSRSHLAQIVPRLRETGVPLRAVEIESLAERPVVLDLLALTRALVHPADRIAWLAVLRAPWCGLTLADLDTLLSQAPRTPVWLLLRDAACTARLSEDGRRRAAALVQALAPALQQARRGTLHDAVAGAWLRLGGADVLREPRDRVDAQAFLDLLAAQEQAGDVADVAALESQIARLYAAPEPPGAAPVVVQVMTIHKAKGLEFDVVLLPGLQRPPRNTEAPLLALAEIERPTGPALVLGAVAATGAERDPVHRWLGALDRERERLEGGRLLYVAATRARQRLHLFGTAATAVKKGVRVDGSLKAPSRTSLLAPLWDLVQPRFAAAAAGAAAAAVPAHEAATGGSQPGDAAAPAGAPLDPRIWRLPVLPPLAADDARLPVLAWSAPPEPGSERALVEFSWAGEAARLVGTVVHRWLQRIAGRGAEQLVWDEQRIGALAARVEQELGQLGLPAGERPTAVARVLAALRASLGDERGRWVLAGRAGAASELRLTGVDGGRLVNVAIDRTFVDAGVRWVIDYKTGTHEGAGCDAFLDREVERYRAQLERYAQLMAGLGPEPVRCGLYFPLLAGWREWAPGDAAGALGKDG
jgi:ATP-dependent exoDNAse (exonuclease V) beta subunit